MGVPRSCCCHIVRKHPGQPRVLMPCAPWTGAGVDSAYSTICRRIRSSAVPAILSNWAVRERASSAKWVIPAETSPSAPAHARPPGWIRRNR